MLAPQRAMVTIEANNRPVSGSEGVESVPRRAYLRWQPGLHVRLFLAFTAISLIATGAAFAALYAFREVGERLSIVDERAPVALTALEISRSAERVIAAAPALLAANDTTQREAIEAELAVDFDVLHQGVRTLKERGVSPSVLSSFEAVIAELNATLDTFKPIVVRRAAVAGQIAAAQREVFRLNAAVDRLMAPWLAVNDAEIAALVAHHPPVRLTEQGGLGTRLATQWRLQKLTQQAQEQFSAAVDTLNEISVADQPRQLLVLNFRLGNIQSDLTSTSRALSPKLQPLFLSELARLAVYVDGSRSLAEMRAEELGLLDAGTRHIELAASLSTRLSSAVNRLSSDAKSEIVEAISTALAVQQASARALVGLVVISFLVSVLIVVFYVGRRIVARLGTLRVTMLSIAEGNLDTPVGIAGNDEIAAMGRAVEVFRRNTAERDQLLARQTEAAERLEREVAERTKELARANAFKARFLAAASHDLRQPLYALNLLVDQLRGADTTRGLPTQVVDRQGGEEVVARIDAALGSINELLGTLLDMTRLEAGLIEPEYSEFALNQLLERIEATFADVARNKGLRLRVLPCHAWVRSDFIQLERIVCNLVANAVRHTVRGGVVVGCRRKGAYLRLDVVDTGPGIAHERRGEIFDEFHQLSVARDPQADSLGLGLAIVDSLSRLLGHELELASHLEQGSRFSVLLPRVPAQGMAANAAMQLVAQVDPLPGKTVVVIDDDELVRESMRSTIERWGCQVLAVPTGEAAVKRLALAKLRPDLLIADCNLGQAHTGTDAIACVRAAVRGEVPAFLISGDTSTARLREASASALHLLHKPISPMNLRAMMMRLLGKSLTPASPTKLP